ncbi:MAG: hypothetical protein N4A76_03245 [Firmicutes bacterium]|jgi:putative membrane fusion protein|nr:hypothetical protein [Bacillota bacterium]
MNRLSRRKRKKRFIGIIVFLIMLIIASRMIYSYLLRDNSTYVAEYGEVVLEKEYNSFILRNETLVSSRLSGLIKYFVTEGERVKKGFKIAEISEIDNSKAQVLSKIENDNIPIIDENALERDIDFVRRNLVEAIRSEDYSSVKKLKKDLNLKLEKKGKLAKGEKLYKEGYNFKESFVEANGNNKMNLYSVASGIVSFKVDGYENTFTMDKLYNIDYNSALKENYEKVNLLRSKVNAGDSIYKIVDNSKWYLVSLIEKSEMDYYKVGQNVSIKLSEEEFQGIIEDEFELDQGAGVLIRINKEIGDFTSSRLVKPIISRKNYRGLKIKLDSLVKNEGNLGVYVLDIDKKARFVEVNVIGYNESEAIVQENYFYRKVGEENKIVTTVKLYDEVVENPTDYKVGDVVK